MSAPRKRKKHEEEHENEERWLITYADMITLLMVLFIVLFSISQVDLKKFETLRAGLAQSFGTATPVLEGAGFLEGGVQPAGEGLNQVNDEKAVLEASRNRTAAAEARELAEAREEIDASLTGQGLGDAVTYRLTPRGLVLQVVTDAVLFDLGRANLRPDGLAVLDGIADALQGLPNALSIEGHTDNRPLRGGGVFPTNWELSTGRATAVLRYFVEQKGFAANRVGAVGYADERPLFPNDSAENQARNRRVEIVVLTQSNPQGSE
jgi:chemotaxis protein MotB